MKVTYNSPIILTLSIIASAIWCADELLNLGLQGAYFTLYPYFDFRNAIDYLRLFSHIVGHANWQHLIYNLLVLLLVGPLVEAYYGSGKLFFMMAVTAIVTSVANILFFNTGLMGASGVGFMLVLVGSFAGARDGEIPLTFLFVAALVFGNQFLEAWNNDTISQFAHIVGGICGSAFGFLLKKAQ